MIRSEHLRPNEQLKQSLLVLEQTLFERRFLDLSGLPAERQAELLAGRCQTVLPNGGLEEKLIRSKNSGEPLEIKFGIDPTGSEVHLGHAVPIVLLQRLQMMGHNITIVIGDSTALIGYSSGRTQGRPALTEEQIKANMANYTQQISPFLDLSKAKIRYNSSWLYPLTLSEIITLASKVKMSQLLQREDFRHRLEAGFSLTMDEAMYAVFMGQDSVHLRTDIEVGGNDQLLNLQTCRDIQTNSGQEPEVIVTVPILPGNGVTDEKMSKSKGNYIALDATPEGMYSQIMSIPNAIGKDKYGRLGMFFKSLTEITDTEWTAIANQLDTDELDPKEVKQMLAHLVTQIVHGKDRADQTATDFELKSTSYL